MTSAFPMRMQKYRRWLLALLLVSTSWGGMSTSRAQNSVTALEYKVKAAFLLNFARFVEWPASALSSTNAPIVIGIVGEDPFGEILQQIVQGQTAQNRPINIRHYAEMDPKQECHILFISRSVTADAQEVILGGLKGRAVLTVSEKENFVKQGGMLGFVLVDKSVRFDVSLKAANAAGLTVSSKLLNVARNVTKP